MSAAQKRAAVSFAYWGRVMAEWLAKYPQHVAEHMLRQVLEYSEIHGQSHFGKIIEIAKGERVA